MGYRRKSISLPARRRAPLPWIAGLRCAAVLNEPNQGRTAILAYHKGLLFTVPELPASQPGSDFEVRTGTYQLGQSAARGRAAERGRGPEPVVAGERVAAVDGASGETTRESTVGDLRLSQRLDRIDPRRATRGAEGSGHPGDEE